MRARRALTQAFSLRLAGGTVLLACLILPLLLPVARAQKPAGPKSVLVLYWYGKDFPANLLLDKGVQAVLRSDTAGAVEYFPEYLESNRFPGENQSLALRDYLRRKYADHRIDVIISMSRPALEFLLKYHKDLFPDTPIVYHANKPIDLDSPMAAGITGVVVDNVYQKTLDLALRLHPRTERVLIITGTPQREKKLEAEVREDLEGFEDQVALTYLTDLPLDELIATVKRAPERSIILYVRHSQDEPGKTLNPADILALVAQSANVPLYGIASYYLGYGAVGGYVINVEACGIKAAEVALQIANGARPQAVPVAQVPSVPMFDWRQLQRWGINEKRLPPGSIVRFQEPTFWERYKGHIISVLALCVLEAALIAWLLLERQRRQRASQALRVSEEQYRAFFELTAVGAGQARPEDGRLLRVNEAHCRITGYTRDELLRMSFIEITHPDDREKDLEKFRHLISGDLSEYSSEKRYVRKDGQAVWVEVHVSLVRDGKGRPIHTVAIVQDITQLKRAEALRTEQTKILEMIPTSAAIEEILSRLALLIESQADGVLCSVILLEEDGVHIRNGASPSLPESYTKFIDGVAIGPRVGSCGAAMYLGKSVIVSDILKDPLWDDYRDLAIAHGLRACWSIPIFSSQARVLGSFAMYCRESRSPKASELHLSELATRIAGIAIERKQAEEALRQNQVRYRLATSAGRVAVFDWDLRTKEIYVDPLLKTSLGYQDHEIRHLDDWEPLFHPEDFKLLGQRLQDYLDGKRPYYELESRRFHKDGSVRWFDARGQAIRDTGGQAIRIIGTVVDITDRKLAEEALRESEERLRLALEAGRMGAWDWDLHTGLIIWSSGIFAILGLEPFSVTPSLSIWRGCVHPDDMSRVEQALNKCIQEKQPCQSEYRLVLPDGTVRWVEGRAKPTLDEAGECATLKGLLIDVTERKQAEEALRASEERYRNVVEAQTELICRYRPDTTLTFVNDAYCRYFGKTREQLIGTKFIKLIPDSERPAAKAHVDSLIANPRIEANEHRVMKADGSLGWQQWIDHVVRDANGQVVELQGIGRDITKRKEAEEELAHLSVRFLGLQDEERRRIARELHDVTAQNLFAATIGLARAERGLQPAELRETLAECQTLCEQSLKEIRTLSYLLHPPMLDQAGLVPALQWYIEGFTRRSGIEVSLLAPEEIGRLSKEVERDLFRVVQEALTNVHRHSGSPVAIIRLERQNHQLVLQIKDQGRGVRQKPGKVNGIELLGVGIRGMHERLLQLSGRLEIESSDQGTTVTAVVPLPGQSALRLHARQASKV